MTRSISFRAISGFVRAVRYSVGTPARSSQARLLVQLSGRNNRNASMTGTSPRASVSDTSVWQLAVLPREWSRVMLKLTKRSLPLEVMQPLRIGQVDYLKRAWPAVPRALCEAAEVACEPSAVGNLWRLPA